MDEKKTDSEGTHAEEKPLGQPVRAETPVEEPAVRQETNSAPETKEGGNKLRNLAFLSIMVFFCMASAAVGMFALGANQAKNEVIEPVRNLVRQLVLPVTPVIMPNPTTIIREIQDLQRLETASFEFEKVITAESKPDLLWGLLGESVVFVANGKVFAGVDFAKMAESMGGRGVRIENPGDFAGADADRIQSKGLPRREPLGPTGAGNYSR